GVRSAGLIDQVLRRLDAILGGLTGPRSFFDLLLELLAQLAVPQVPAHGSSAPLPRGDGIGSPQGMAKLRRSRAYKRLSPGLSRVIYPARKTERRGRGTARFGCFGSLVRSGRGGRCRVGHGLLRGRCRERRLGRGIVPWRRLAPFRVGHARLLSHEPSNAFAVRRLESEEFGEVPRGREGEGT